MKLTGRQAQRGVTLIVGMIMLVLITVLVISAFTLSVTNLKAVGNMQMRNEAIAAANKSIEDVVSTEFPANFAMPPSAATPTPSSFTVDVNNDGTPDYTVKIGTEIAQVGGHYVASPGSGQWIDALCVQAKPVAVNQAGTASSETLVQQGFSLPANVNSALFDIKATVTDAASGASVEVHEGVRVELSDEQKALMCP